MALFQDKRKPVDIYAKGSPTVKAQQVTSSAATAPIRAAGNVAFAPAKALMKNVVAPAAQTATKPLVDASKRNQRFMAQEKAKVTGSAANREADALLYGSGEKQVGGTGAFSPVEARKGLGAKPATQQATPAIPQRDGIQSQRIDPATASSFRRAVTPPASPYTAAAEEAMRQTRTVYTNSGNNITAQQQPMAADGPAAVRPQVGNSRRISMNQQTGNLDIQFDPGTDEQSIRRFMENPIRPTAAIDRYNARYGPGASQGQMSQGQRASMNASAVLAGGQTNGSPPPRFSPGGPSRTWGQAASSDRAAIANAESRRDYYNQVETGLKERELAGEETKNANDLALNTDRNNISRFQANSADATGREQNAINRAKADSDAAVNSAAVAGSQFDLGRKQQIDTIRKKYATAPEGPEREALGRQLTGMGEAVDAGKAYELERGKLSAQENKTRVEEDKVTMQSIDKLEGPEKTRALVSMYDPKAPPSQLQKMAKASIKELGLQITDGYRHGSGMFKSDPVPEILSQYFPPGISPETAEEILNSIPDATLRLRLGKEIGRQYDQY